MIEWTGSYKPRAGVTASSMYRRQYTCAGKRVGCASKHLQDASTSGLVERSLTRSQALEIAPLDGQAPYEARTRSPSPVGAVVAGLRQRRAASSTTRAALRPVSLSAASGGSSVLSTDSRPPTPSDKEPILRAGMGVMIFGPLRPGSVVVIPGPAW